MAVAATAIAGAASRSAGAAAGQPGHPSWFTSWAQSQQWLASTVLDNQSVRMITHLSQGGDALRIRVQNTFGATPLVIDAATVAHSDGRPALTGPARTVTFHGRGTVVVPAGG